jgi:hypothetical protein
MSDLEKMELADRIKAMDVEEKQLAVKLFPSDILIDEIKRRNEQTEKMIAGIRDLVKVKG